MSGRPMLERGGDITFVDTDVTEPADWASLVAAASERNGGVDVLLNNAGLTRAGLLHEMSREHWDLVLNVDLNAVFHGAQAVLPGMVERGAEQSSTQHRRWASWQTTTSALTQPRSTAWWPHEADSPRLRAIGVAVQCNRTWSHRDAECGP
ncbi:SDR family NAD(P)-dependent oxidoreductase [Rhodococcus opacus]|nr:SDR family NAD(P)-dependent oxidoreductase [Rhodococcus opacus]